MRGVESERDMYYARKTQGSTRLIGIAVAIVVNLVVGYVLVTGMGDVIIKKLVDTQVVIIDKPKVEDKEPPPPPPVDVDLPPPPPQVILPDFTFDTPPPPTAITQVAPVAKPAPPPVAKPAPAPVMTVRPTTRKNGERPEYPAASRRAKEEGVVSLTLCVDASGKITKAELRKTSGFPRLDQATLDWIQRERLNPAMQGKTPISICDYPLDYQWQLKDN
jgi:periplasmic protein TonB